MTYKHLVDLFAFFFRNVFRQNFNSLLCHINQVDNFHSDLELPRYCWLVLACPVVVIQEWRVEYFFRLASI